MNITLDTNCLIDLEETRNDYEYIKFLIQLQKANKIQISIAATSASEKNVSGELISNFSQFRDWLSTFELEGAQIYKPILYTDISFYDYCVFAGGAATVLDHKIHDVLFPEIPYSRPEPKDFAKWKNAKADVLIIWCHIWNQGDIFVTSDKNFFKSKKHQSLIDLGANKIATPKKCKKILQQNSI